MRTIKQMWEIKQAAEPNTLELYIYGDVEGDGYDWWSGQTIESETSANKFRDELSAHQNITNIKLFINSYGGSVFEGTAIYNQLRRHPAHKTVYVDGFACSIAATIAMAGDTVVMPRNSMMMIHNAWMYASGNPEELRKAADDLEQINKGNRQAYLQKAGDKIDETELMEMLDNETWLTAEDCIRLGFADEYAEEDADLAKNEKMLQKANLTLQQRIAVQTSLAAQLRQLTKAQNEPPVAQSANPKEGEADFILPEEEPKQKLFCNFKEDK
ncbi:Clp protease ClpP [Ruminococcaceae bacterium OttesenSCG-928-A16]|nr:Clp protease ClpP [Ruminococcaceae bacterium OttesenSCG-928-A16]